MKKLYIITLACIAFLSSCQEFEPIFANYNASQPEPYKVWTKEEVAQKYGKFLTIAEVAQMYVEHVASLPADKKADNASRALPVRKPYVVCGVVSTNDQPGNFYKSFYIQDETGGMEIKIGTNGLYNNFKPGQTVYVSLNGLTVGMYGFKAGIYYGNGMVQVGFTDASGEYETAYLENKLLIDTHILRGDPKALAIPSPAVISKSDLPGKFDTQASNHYIGKLVKMKGMTYANESFVLLYLDSNKDKKSYTNRVFLSDSNGTGACGPSHGITTLAMSKAKMTEYLKSGIWDDAKVGSGNDFTGKTLGDYRGADASYEGVEKAAYSVSQYFTFQGSEIQLRTSGYCKFCDFEMPEGVIGGEDEIDVTGVLTLYQGSYQLVVNSAADFINSETQQPIYKQ